MKHLRVDRGVRPTLLARGRFLRHATVSAAEAVSGQPHAKVMELGSFGSLLVLIISIRTISN